MSKIENFIKISDDKVLEYLQSLNDFFNYLSDLDDEISLDNDYSSNLHDKLIPFYVNLVLDFLEKRVEKERSLILVLKNICKSDYSIIDIDLISPVCFHVLHDKLGAELCSNNVYIDYYYKNQLILDRLKENSDFIKAFRADDLTSLMQLEIKDYESTIYIPQTYIYLPFLDTSDPCCIQYKSAAAFFGASEIFSYIDSKCSFNEHCLVKCAIIGNNLEIYHRISKSKCENIQEYYELAVYSLACNILEHFNNSFKDEDLMNRIKLANADISSIYGYFSGDFDFTMDGVSYKTKDKLREQRWRFFFDETVSIFR